MDEYVQMETKGETTDTVDKNKRKKGKKNLTIIPILYKLIIGILIIIIMILPSYICYKIMNNQMKEHLEKVQKEIPSKLLPKGIIVSWYGSIKEIPKWWALCDGNNTTPDLRNRFIIGGGDKYKIGEKGGNSFIVLNKTNLPKLGKGYFSSPSKFGHFHQRTDELIEYLGYYSTGFKGGWLPDEWGASYKIDLNEGFDSTPVDIMNPYYSIFYIMKIEWDWI